MKQSAQLLASVVATVKAGAGAFTRQHLVNGSDVVAPRQEVVDEEQRLVGGWRRDDPDVSHEFLGWNLVAPFCARLSGRPPRDARPDDAPNCLLRAAMGRQRFLTVGEASRLQQTAPRPRGSLRRPTGRSGDAATYA